MARSIDEYRLYAGIRRQPEELQRLLTAPEPIDLAAEALDAARRVVTVGIGTSWNAASLAAMQLRAAGVDATAWSPHDLVGYPPDVGSDDAAILFTHTGAKRFPRLALELLGKRGAAVVLVTSTESEIGAGDLPMGTTILRTTERERSAMFTLSHTAAMLLTARVVDAIRPGVLGDLAAVPPAVEEALSLESALLALAEAWAGSRTIIALGAGPHECSAREVAIKIAEAARRPVQGHALEQFLHGLQVPVEASDAVLLFAGHGPTLERTRAAAAFVQQLGCSVAWVSPTEAPERATWLAVPDVGELLAPIVEAVPAQLLGGQLAAAAGVDGDVFRTDDPTFAAARSALDL